MALGPIVGPAHFPDWLPRPLTSYLGGQRPMSWFPLFPWLAWPLIGVALGHCWVRQSRDPRRQARAFVLTGIVGAAMTGAVILVRRIDPYIIRYPSDMVQQMGPGTFFYRLGTWDRWRCCAYLVTGSEPPRLRFSMMRQFGQTSLLVYWIHVNLCYGLVSAPASPPAEHGVEPRSGSSLMTARDARASRCSRPGTGGAGHGAGRDSARRPQCGQRRRAAVVT